MSEAKLPKAFSCSFCHQPAVICFVSVNQGACTQHYICSSCAYPTPYYSRNKDASCAEESQLSIALACSQCKSEWCLDSATPRMGCHLCYTSFRSQLIALLIQCNAISSSFTSAYSHQEVFHIGRHPEASAVANSFTTLIALNAALQDTLMHEDYERAATIRDQIKHLKNQQIHDSASE